MEVVEEVGYDWRLHVHLLAAARHRGGRAGGAGAARGEARAHGAARASWCSAARSSARSASSGRTMEVLVEGPSRTDPARLRGRTRHNKTVNFAGLARPGELAQVEITARDERPRWPARSCCSRGRSLERRSNRDLRSDRGRQDRGGDRAGRPAARPRRGSGGDLGRRPPGLRGPRDPERRGRPGGARAAGAPPGRLRARSRTRSRVGEFMPLAHAEIDSALAEGRRPIVVGGTGLYLRAALTQLDLQPPPPAAVRARWTEEVERRGPRSCTGSCWSARPGRWRGSRQATAAASCARSSWWRWGSSSPARPGAATRSCGPRTRGGRRCSPA